MKIYNVKEHSLPLDIRILVYAYNVEKPGWYIDKFLSSGKSDHLQPNGNFYVHNISHWTYLPQKP